MGSSLAAGFSSAEAVEFELAPASVFESSARATVGVLPRAEAEAGTEAGAEAGAIAICNSQLQ
jgi:hypothetical protein